MIPVLIITHWHTLTRLVVVVVLLQIIIINIIDLACIGVIVGSDKVVFVANEDSPASLNSTRCKMIHTTVT
jgi:hypothetical protein